MSQDASDLATAHQVWDQQWQQPSLREAWSDPEPLVRDTAPLLAQRKLTRVLDLGCGIGRHALFLAQQAFDVIGIDASEAALSEARARSTPGLKLEYRQGPFYELPFQNEEFGVAIAWNVLYHGDGDIAARAIREIQRVLQTNGILIGTMLSKRNEQFGQGTEVRPDTFVVEGAPDDKGHPHFYCDAAALLQLHGGFEPLLLRDREQSPGAFHWEFVFERR